MTNLEFSDEFDVLYNNITSNQAPGLDEYEKSVFLTKALDEIVKSYFNPRLNKPLEGFDGNERRLIDFSMLIKTEQCNVINAVTEGFTALFPLAHSEFFAVPDRILMFINESLAVLRGGTPTYLSVVPLAYTEYNRLMSKPYKRPLKNLAWRILTNSKTVEASTKTDYGNIASKLANRFKVNYSIVFNTINSKKLTWGSDLDDFNLLVEGTAITTGGTLEGTAAKFTLAEKKDYSHYIDYTSSTNKSVVEVIPGPNDSIISYTIRYVARPRAIIINDLEGVTLDGDRYIQECELDPILHPEILQRAVELAKAAYIGDLQSLIALGQTSQTNMGIVAQSR